MHTSDSPIKALGLCSGGLDSILSALMLRDQGIDVTWISFETPFFSAGKARRASQATGIALITRDITPVYLKMLRNPPCGYGQHMNPCMDCHTLMFHEAGRLMKREKFHFLFSGEVLGQRPMSQTRPSLRYVEKHSGFAGWILRPLSAKRLPETIPEQKGWVDRELLGDLAGRSRKPQIQMAFKFGIHEYPTPAGGCLLTDKGYSRRLKDLFSHEINYTPESLHLLKYGRHLRLPTGFKIIVGRTRSDNEHIVQHVDTARDTVIRLAAIPGPTVLVPDCHHEETIRMGAAICAGYSKAPPNEPLPVRIHNARGRSSLTVTAMSPSAVQAYLI